MRGATFWELRECLENFKEVDSNCNGRSKSKGGKCFQGCPLLCNYLAVVFRDDESLLVSQCLVLVWLSVICILMLNGLFLCFLRASLLFCMVLNDVG